MPLFKQLLLWTLATVLGGSLSGADTSANPGEEVVVVANREFPGSERIARHYLKARNIPENNLVLLSLPEEGRIDYPVFVEQLHNPLLEELVARDLVSAELGKGKGPLGRFRLAGAKRHFKYLVLVRGVPFHLNAPGETVDEALLDEWKGLGQLKAQFREGRLAKAEASVDGELAMLLFSDVPLRGFIPNPLHLRESRPESFNLLKVTRLDGPETRHVMGMIDRAVATEKQGLQGRAYVDLDGRGGGYAAGNEWLRKAASVFENNYFPTTVEETPKTFPSDARLEAPALYAGWYAHHLDGPFANPGFRFPEGAVAVHLHSFSASNLRDASTRWVGPFIAKGVTATLGNTSEPFLALTHHLGAFFEGLARGWNFADAAYYALPGLSWQAVALGDPLYRPFAVDLDTQIANLGEDPARMIEDSYVVLRRMELARAEGSEVSALGIGRSGILDTPGPSLVYESALLEAEENPDRAIRILGMLQHTSVVEPEYWGLILSAGESLAEWGDAASGLNLVRPLVEEKDLPEAFRRPALKRAAAIAEKAGDWETASSWRQAAGSEPE